MVITMHSMCFLYVMIGRRCAILCYQNKHFCIFLFFYNVFSKKKLYGMSHFCDCDYFVGTYYNESPVCMYVCMYTHLLFFDFLFLKYGVRCCVDILLFNCIFF